MKPSITKYSDALYDIMDCTSLEDAKKIAADTLGLQIEPATDPAQMELFGKAVAPDVAAREA